MDLHNVIKVSDFGLSEDMYAKNYFRQDKDAAVKLPIKWMAPESLNDGIFTEKTDVVKNAFLHLTLIDKFLLYLRQTEHFCV